MTSYVPARANTAYKFYVALVDQSNTKLTKAAPTIAAGDFKVSTDGGAFANLATLPSANPAAGRAVMIDLSAGEMNGANIVVQCVDAAGAEWCDLIVNIQTSTRQMDDLAYPATSGRSIVVDAAGLVDANAVKVGPTGAGTAQTAGDLKGTLGAPAGASVSVDVAAVKTDTAAVKVQTDKLTFTVANVLDSNVLRINGVAGSAANLRRTTEAIARGTASGVPTTTSIPTSAFTPAGAVADQFKGRIITFDADTTTTALRGQSTDITASSNAATPILTVTALTTAPVAGDLFSVT